MKLSHTFVLLALVHALPISAQVSGQVRLVIRTSNAQSTFQIGEVIPVYMEFTGPADGSYSPGKYTVAVRSGRVFSLSSGANGPLKLQSNSLHLTIVPASEEWQRKTTLAATGTLDSTQPSGTSYPDDRRSEAINALRYLGTGDAALALIRYLDVGDLEHAAYLGLVSSNASEPALAEMRLRLADPDWPVTPDFLAATVELALPRDAGSEQVWRERQNLEEQFINDLKHFVAQKRGEALKVSQRTILFKTHKQ